MSSPVLNENIMLEALKQSPPEALGENARRLRTGAVMLLLDAFDRKVTRDQFIAALGSATELIDMLGRFEIASNVKEFEATSGRVTKADIEVMIDRVTKQIAEFTAQCSKMAELVHQCALDEDKVH
jgi:hypothetical protein